MKKYRLWNNLLGWVVFAIATFTYFSTLEPTASWWDCGEYISTAFKLQVGHPPGAPTFQLIGRFFSLFAFGNVKNVAMMINVMSALCSSFTILFLFWSITLLAKKIVGKGVDLSLKENKSKALSIFVAGIIGSLAYTFSDTFWFSAVEGEVYAMSSLCTAIVFWAILRWEEQDNKTDAARWIVFIAFVIGLSIGVHLLNLLAIPAIALVLYYKNYKPNTKGFLVTLLISFLLVAGILYGLVPLIVKLASAFELLFVNRFHTPFNTGTVIYFILLIGILVLLWLWSIKKGKLLWNTVVISLVYIIIGYSTFFIIVIRANTNTPINEGAPSDAIGLLAYLNREQYGATPVIYGPYYYNGAYSYTPYAIDVQKNDVVRKRTPKVYVKDSISKRYILTDDGLPGIPQFEKKFMTVFPRMWNGQRKEYIDAYKALGNVSELPNEYSRYLQKNVHKPTFKENLTYFFRYQVGHMYVRYFMWNFAGRQNDIEEGYLGYDHGNWKCGIKFIDEARLGSQDNIPDSIKSNPANNSFYLLPLILGLIGFWFHFSKSPQGGSIILALFFMTGLAIIIYLNQQPFQPRERDYAYAGSFYAFAIWIGFGSIQLINWLEKLLKNKTIAVVVALLLCLSVPAVMAKDGWDDHNRHGKYAARDFAENYISPCAPNAILISNGDNDTFPLWYVQEVENFRTDVRIMNYMLSGSDWYAHQMMRKVYDSEKVPLTMSKKDYYKGVNELIFYKQVFKNETVLDIKDFITYLHQGKLGKVEGNKVENYFPTKKFKLKVDKEKVLANGIVPPEMADRIVDEIVWTVNKNYLTKNDILLFDFLASFDWDRPLYFTSPQIVKDVFNIDKYCYMQGISYKFIPVEPKEYMVKQTGSIDVDASYDLLVNKYNWGRLNDPKVVVDRESARNCSSMIQHYYRLSYALLFENKLDSVAMLIDKYLEYFPIDKIKLESAYRSMYVGFVENYFQSGRTEKAMSLLEQVFDIIYSETAYYIGFQGKYNDVYDYHRRDIEDGLRIMNALVRHCESADNGRAIEYKDKLNTLLDIAMR